MLEDNIWKYGGSTNTCNICDKAHRIHIFVPAATRTFWTGFQLLQKTQKKPTKLESKCGLGGIVEESKTKCIYLEKLSLILNFLFKKSVSLYCIFFYPNQILGVYFQPRICEKGMFGRHMVSWPGDHRNPVVCILKTIHRMWEYTCIQWDNNNL